ncbi:MAG: MFS transporter, partial [Candidatus Thorarchaeota archaeon]|nr:MFS transporter [Candidatus Thorarchaeota archaeon]NIW14977.1 MFS transporter [Candidatus Thorarchaeota archaeon]NIW52988.1 MFS transporter [Candidatus Korarchaeota archaeon]
LNAIVLFTYSYSPSFLVLLILIFIAGISSTTFHPATYSLIAMKSSEEHLTKSMAIHQFGGFFGGAIGTALVAFLASFLGWR